MPGEVKESKGRPDSELSLTRGTLSFLFCLSLAHDRRFTETLGGFVSCSIETLRTVGCVKSGEILRLFELGVW